MLHHQQNNNVIWARQQSPRSQCRQSVSTKRQHSAHSQALAPEALATLLTPSLKLSLRCVRPQRGSEPPVEVPLVHGSQSRNLPP